MNEIELLRSAVAALGGLAELRKQNPELARQLAEPVCKVVIAEVGESLRLYDPLDRMMMFDFGPTVDQVSLMGLREWISET